MLEKATAQAAIAQIQVLSSAGAGTMILASTLSTIEAVIPYLILAAVVVFFVVRLVVIPLIDLFVRTRQRRNERTE